MSTTAEAESRIEAQVTGSPTSKQVVVCLGTAYLDAPPEAVHPIVSVLLEAFGSGAAKVMLAYPVSDAQAESWQQEGVTLQPYQQATQSHPLSIQTASSYLSLFEVMRAHDAECGLLLGGEAHTLLPATVRTMVNAVLEKRADMALPRYSVGPNDALINAAILHPLTRALFGVQVAFPMAIDIALSYRAAEKMASAALVHTASAQGDGLLWPTVEAAVAGFSVAEVTSAQRETPQPATSDLSTILNTLAASLFAEVELKASFWQRTRPVPPTLHLEGVPLASTPAVAVSHEEVAEIVESFRIGYGNLHELWALVLPPQTLLGLKRLSRVTAEEFVIPDALWVRVIYDFALAHRLRTINRGHLLGSLTPLYLAWVASHINQATTENPPEAVARAFEADKPYLVSRWRWPDRFNP